jgi:alkylation response protein AidB-like acyl-CoA dehydrogenase
MRFALTPEQRRLQEEARAFLAGTPSPAWSQLAALGWTGAEVAVEHGGAGLAFVETGILLEELARALAPGPFYATSVLLPALPPDTQRRVAAGEESWVLALGPLVPDLDTATNVASVGGDGIYELVGAERVLLESIDPTRQLGVVQGGEAGRLLASSELLPMLRSRSLTALALEACGVGERALELAVEHARNRRQFGREIGAYQAVAHGLATSWVDLELARSLALRAAWCVANLTDDADLRAAAAKAHAAEAAVAACERAIQTLGALGFTWESPLHRLYRRALGIRSWEASSAQLRSEVAERLLAGGEP